MQQCKKFNFKVVMILMWLICSSNTINWQGTGNMSQDNLTVIWNFMNANLNTSMGYEDILMIKPTYLPDLVTNLSNLLNDQWAPAWNVFVIYPVDHISSDSVCYGYGFRNHWMWYNGILMADEIYLGFVIWKDYNCHTWTTYQTLQSPTSTMTQAQDSDIDSILNQEKKSTMTLDNIWLVAKTVVQLLEDSSKFQNSAFSVVIHPSGFVAHFGRFCALGYKLIAIEQQGNGRALIMKMR